MASKGDQHLVKNSYYIGAGLDLLITQHYRYIAKENFYNGGVMDRKVFLSGSELFKWEPLYRSPEDCVKCAKPVL